METQEIYSALAKSYEKRASKSLANVKREARLREDLGMDSLELLEMVVEVERQFRIQIDEDEFQSIETIEDVVQVVAKKLAGAATAQAGAPA